MVTTVLIAAFAWLALSGPSDDDRVREAIAKAVTTRMGVGAEVTIDSLTIDAAIEDGVVIAIPEPDSKLGRPMRFVLRLAGDRRGRSGFATATIRVRVTHAHATRNLDRGVDIADGDLVSATHDISNAVLRALPTLDVASHARTMRPIAQDACITAPAIAALPAVRGGRDVAAIVRIDGVEAQTTVTASQNGDAGAVIRVVNRQTQRALKARVVSAGLVEIIHD